MKREEIKAIFYELITQEMSVDTKCISDSMNFSDDLAMDSLDEIELVMAVEEEFDIMIDDDPAESMKTVGQAIDGIAALLIVPGKKITATKALEMVKRPNFKREARYVVVKISDMVAAELTQRQLDNFNAVCDKISGHRAATRKEPLQCVVVEKDWPEYEPTWSAIEKRCS